MMEVSRQTCIPCDCLNYFYFLATILRDVVLSEREDYYFVITGYDAFMRRQQRGLYHEAVSGKFTLSFQNGLLTEIPTEASIRTPLISRGKLQ